MQRRSIIFIFCLLAASSASQAQQYITHGKIEFERKTNQHAFLEEGSMWDDMMKKIRPNSIRLILTYTSKMVFRFIRMAGNQKHVKTRYGVYL